MFHIFSKINLFFHSFMIDILNLLVGGTYKNLLMKDQLLFKLNCVP